MRASYRLLIGLLVSLRGLAVSAMPGDQGVDAATQARVVAEPMADFRVYHLLRRLLSRLTVAVVFAL